MASPPSNPTNPNQPANFMPSVRAASEKKLGMLHYTSPASHGWHGDVRKRYTDFLVNEIRKDGKVLHLENYDVAERPADVNIFLPGQQGSPNNLTSYSAEIAPARTVTEDDEKALRALLGEATTTEVLNLYQRIVASGTTRLDPQINLVKFLSMERDVRGRVHQEIRRIFDSRIATETDGDGIITAIPASIRFARKPRAAGSGGRNQRSNQPSFKKLGGDYLHFTLYKENKDTMDAVNQIGRILRVKSNNFGFAGTKDRRAATVQRVSVYRVRHKVLDFLNTQLPYMKMGDYKYSPYPIQLGDHGGNEFNIVVKDVGVKRGEDCSLERRVQLTKQAVETAVNEMVKYGFINYYGLQRFGTHIVGTHELGKLMLMEKFNDVVDGILHVDKDFMNQVVAGTVQETPSSRDEINRARAIVQFKTYKNAKSALQLMPKRFASEMNVIQHLEKSPRDFTGAILTITRGMRNLYLHAYQSYVWNHAASHRWAKYGSKVIPGDLVLVTPEDTVVDDSIGGSEESQYQKARALSEEQANSGKYTIYDIVLPGPGFDVVYPDNDIGEFYVEFMLRPENGGLDPHRMRRSTKDFSVSGSYRHVLGRMKGQPKWEVRTYVDENDQMVPTDLDLIELRKAAEKPTLQKEAAEQVAGNQAVAVTAEAGQLADDGAAKTERRRQREDPESDPRANETWTEVSQNGGSKRIKLVQDESRPDTPDSVDTRGPHGGGAPLWEEDGENHPVKPIRQPIIPSSSAGATTATPSATPTPQLATASPTISTFNETDTPEKLEKQGQASEVPGATIQADNAPTDAAHPKTPALQVPRPDRDAYHAFTQPDLSQYKDDEVKIAVVLQFSLGTSAYATIVLRELMAEIEPEQPGSPLYPPDLSG